MKQILCKIIVLLFCFGNGKFVYPQFGGNCERFPNIYGPLQLPDCETGVYTLIFEDEFNGNTYDANKWQLRPYAYGEKLGGLNYQIYTTESDNLEVSNGTLKIKANNVPKTRRVFNYCPPECGTCLTEQDIDNCILSDGLPNLRTYQYSSSNIWSVKDDFHYGKYEIRCRISAEKGMWPAFWIYSGDNEPGGTIWNENDFFEIYHNGSEFRYTNNIHYDFNNDGETYLEQCKYPDILNAFPFSDDFSDWHTFTIYFEEDIIYYYVDNVLINSKQRWITQSGDLLFCGDGLIAMNSALELTAWPRQPAKLILNMAIETGSDSPDASNNFPAIFEIDYVRYWEKEPFPVPCLNDVVIFYPFNSAHAGRDAYLFGGATVQPGNVALVEAQNEISITQGFHAQAGSVFNAKINPYACGSLRVGDSTEVNDTNTRVLGNVVGSIGANTIRNNKKTLNEVKRLDSKLTKDEEQGKQFSVYPNPHTGKFTVTFGNSNTVKEIVLVDVFGKIIVSQQSTDNSITLNLADYSRGVYLLKVTANNTTYVEKVVYQ